MSFGTVRRSLAHKSVQYAVVLLLSVGAYTWGENANCFAQQKVTVSPGANLQALVNQYPASTTFTLTAGTYRLQSVVPKSGDSFVGQTGALLSGAALLTNFVKSGSVWVATASVQAAGSYPGAGNCLASNPLCQYPEDLFFNSVIKTRVSSQAAVTAGTWYLNYSTGQVYTGDNPTGQTVELSELRNAFSGNSANVTISNLIVEKYAAFAQAGAIDGSGGSSYWAVGGNTVRFNHGTGIRTGNGMYIYNNQVYYNGQLGIGGSGSGLCIQNNTIYKNNASGYSYYWEAGGVKLASASNVTFQYNYSYSNQGPGFWTDINTSTVTVNENQFTNNVEAGVMVEISNAITVSNNYIWDDGFNPSGTGIWWGAGILVDDSTFVSIYGNAVVNCMDGIAALLTSHGNGPNGQPYTLNNLSATGNTVTQSTGTAAGIGIEGTGFTNAVYTSWNNTMVNNTWNLATPNYDYFYWMQEPMTMTQFNASAGAK